MRNTHAQLWALLVTAVLVAAGGAAAHADSIDWSDHDLTWRLAEIALGQRVDVDKAPLAADLPAAKLELRRVLAFTDDARIVIHGTDGVEILAPPDTRRFIGTIVGVPGSRVLLSSSERAVRLLAFGDGRAWVGAWGFGERAPLPRELTAAELRDPSRSYTCGNEEFGELVGALATGIAGDDAADPIAQQAARLPSYTARVAVETDFEFFQKFGSTTAATDYVGDLMAFVTSIYEAEIDTSILVQHLSLWTTSGDPWTQIETKCGLMEFGRHWNDNHGGVDRTIAHFMSGKNNGGGIAWVGVLCTGQFNVNLDTSFGIDQCLGLSPRTDNYGGGYGYSGDMDGNFNPSNPGIVWDVVVVAHEMGHNFNSPHTHCYGGIGGSSQPVDTCYSGEGGCYLGSPSLPCATPGAGCGTLMSYCHLRSGGLGNIAPTFGEGHPWGVLPQRVPDRMLAHVVSRAGSNPGCLDLSLPDLLFVDGFESGGVGAWSSSVP